MCLLGEVINGNVESPAAHGELPNTVRSISSNGESTKCLHTTMSSILKVDSAEGDLDISRTTSTNHLLKTIPIYDRSYDHTIGGLRSQMNLSSWLHKLFYKDDLDLCLFLESGIRDGFIIVDRDCDFDSYYCHNYSSATHGSAFEYVDKIILNKLSQDKYIISEDVPHCVHSLGAVPKKDGGYRIITDCKQPLGLSINNFMEETTSSFSYNSIDDLVDMLYHGAYMANVDIASAYRSISVHPSQWAYQGLSWCINGVPVHLKDLRICFGLRNAPFLFTTVSNFIVRCMNRRGYHKIVNYLDDFIILAPDFESCQKAQSELIALLGSLGFLVSWKKCSSPSMETRFLGININSINMQLSLPEDKMSKLHNELSFFEHRSRATKRQLQRLCGILSHCSKLIKGARTFSRRVIELLKGLGEGNPIVKLNDEFIKDLDWWRKFAKTFNGVACCIEYNYGQGPILYTDTSQTGYGFYTPYDWQAGFFDSELVPYFVDNTQLCHHHWMNVDTNSTNINELEIIPVLLAIQRISSNIANRHVVLYTDNTQVMSNINTGVSTNKFTMTILRQIFWVCVTNNIHLTARHVHGSRNVIADYLSRICMDQHVDLGYFNLCCS